MRGRWSARYSKKPRSSSLTVCMPSSFVLVIAEKPKAAQKIAYALSDGFNRKCSYNGIPFWVVNWRGKIHVIAPAAGHLFGLTTDEHGFPVFKYYWAPLFIIDKSAKHIRKFYNLLEKLAKHANSYINACDYDIEGSVIGYMIIRELGDIRYARRAVFSTLTATDIRRAFSNLQRLDVEMVEAGLARHELDWIWGINVSRALMEAYRVVTGKRISLSAGRVQSPTLLELSQRDFERNTFVPLPIFRVYVVIDIGGARKRIVFMSTVEKDQALEYASLLRRERVLLVKDVKIVEKHVPPPPPFNLGDLQSEAGRIYGISPLQAQNIAESLYLEALISYPRTNSQKIPPSIDVREIVSKLSAIPEYKEVAYRLLRRRVLRPRMGSKDDPAHPAIHPTGVVPRSLSKKEWIIYDLIVRRFLASMADPVIIREYQLELVAPRYTSVAKKLKLSFILEKGWASIYPFTVLPSDGDSTIARKIRPQSKIPILSVQVRTEYSQPPPAYTKTSIVKWMEGVGIGTEATRARIVENLFSRGYLTQSSGKIVVTDLGHTVAEVLQMFFNEITSVKLTRYFETKLNEIRAGRTTRQEVVKEAREFIARLLEEFRSRHMRVVGNLIASSLNSSSINVSSRCVVCGRRAVSGNVKLCRYHLAAVERLRETYREWQKRERGINWREYLTTVRKRRETGKWVKEVIESGVIS